MHEALRDVRTNLRLEDGDFRSIVITSPEGTTARRPSPRARHDARASRAGGPSSSTGTCGGAASPSAPGSAPGPASCDALTGAPVSERRPGDGGRGPGGASRAEMSPPIPGDLLRAVSPVLRQVREAYDVAVIDTTPLVPINDARVLAGVLGCHPARRQRRRASQARLQAAVDRLTLLSVSPTAFILNRSRERVESDYYVTIPERAEPRHARRRAEPRAGDPPRRRASPAGPGVAAAGRPALVAALGGAASRSRLVYGRSRLPCSRSGSSSVSPPSLSASFGSTSRCWCSSPRSRWRPPSRRSPRCSRSRRSPGSSASRASSSTASSRGGGSGRQHARLRVRAPRHRAALVGAGRRRRRRARDDVSLRELRRCSS